MSDEKTKTTGLTRSQDLAAAGFVRRPSLWAMQAREALELIAAPVRPDGTWNRDREACRRLAAEALGRYDEPVIDDRPKSAAETAAAFVHGMPADQAWAQLKSAAGWLRAINEAMVTHHAGVAEAGDTYEAAKAKLDALLAIAQDIGAYHERDRIKAALLGMDDAVAGRHNYYAHAACVLFERW